MKQNKIALTVGIFLKHALRYKWALVFLIFSIIFGTAVNLYIPFFYKDFFDILGKGTLSSETTKALFRILVFIGLLQLLQWVIWRVATLISNYFNPIVSRDLANTCFEYLHKNSFSFFNNNFAGSLVKRVKSFYRAFDAISERIFWQFLTLCINVVVILVILFKKNPILGGIMAVWLIVFSLANWFLTNFKMKYELQKSEAETKASGILADTIANHSNVKLFTGYAREVSYFKEGMEKVRKLSKFTYDLDTIFDGIQGLLTILLEVGMFYYAIILAGRGVLSLGDFVLIQTFLLQIINHLWDFGRMLRSIYTNLAEAEEMTDILTTPHEIRDKKNAKKLTVSRGEIQFQNVHFYYQNTRPILTDFDLFISSKERVAFVGHSGAGKSTVVRILLRMHDISSGAVLIDSENISEVTQESLWKNVSLVPQEPILFHRTLYENIAYGRPNAREEEVYRAAKLAHCEEFIAKLPEGYATYVGERGVKLSGGERQRIAIARAILYNSPILILDEATSSLDSESEKLIQEALEELMKNKTVIVIAHRLSTIMKMDRIILMENGTVVEEGSHTALLQKKNGRYKQLWDLQVGGFIQEDQI